MRARTSTGQFAIGTSADFWARVQKSDGCWTWLGRKCGDGYGRLGWKGRVNVGAHRVAWALAHGYWPSAWVLHCCDNPSCVRPDHLFLGSVQDNNRDRQHKGRTGGFIQSGPSHHAFKVTADLREQAQLLRSADWTQQQIAEWLGLSRGHVSKILGGVA